ncbi:hypothetical protein EDD86DRAFT_201906, partial [Gorgonomyces haynaldii]
MQPGQQKKEVNELECKAEDPVLEMPSQQLLPKVGLSQQTNIWHESNAYAVPVDPEAILANLNAIPAVVHPQGIVDIGPSMIPVSAPQMYHPIGDPVVGAFISPNVYSANPPAYMSPVESELTSFHQSPGSSSASPELFTTIPASHQIDALLISTETKRASALQFINQHSRSSSTINTIPSPRLFIGTSPNAPAGTYATAHTPQSMGSLPSSRGSKSSFNSSRDSGELKVEDWITEPVTEDPSHMSQPTRPLRHSLLRENSGSGPSPLRPNSPTSSLHFLDTKRVSRDSMKLSSPRLMHFVRTAHSPLVSRRNTAKSNEPAKLSSSLSSSMEPHSQMPSNSSIPHDSISSIPETEVRKEALEKPRGLPKNISINRSLDSLIHANGSSGASSTSSLNEQFKMADITTSPNPPRARKSGVGKKQLKLVQKKEEFLKHQEEIKQALESSQIDRIREQREAEQMLQQLDKFLDSRQEAI